MPKDWFTGEEKPSTPPPAEQPEVFAEVVPDKVEPTPSQKKIAEDIQSTLDELEKTGKEKMNAPLNPNDFRSGRATTIKPKTEAPPPMEAAPDELIGLRKDPHNRELLKSFMRKVYADVAVDDLDAVTALGPEEAGVKAAYERLQADLANGVSSADIRANLYEIINPIVLKARFKKNIAKQGAPTDFDDLKLDDQGIDDQKRLD